MLTSHAGDLLVIGKKHAVERFFQEDQNTLEFKYAGVGTPSTTYPGRRLQKTETGFEFGVGTDYLSEILREFHK